MSRHARIMRWLNRLRHIRSSWGPRAVERYFWRFVYGRQRP